MNFFIAQNHLILLITLPIRRESIYITSHLTLHIFTMRCSSCGYNNITDKKTCKGEVKDRRTLKMRICGLPLPKNGSDSTSGKYGNLVEGGGFIEGGGSPEEGR